MPDPSIQDVVTGAGASSLRARNSPVRLLLDLVLSLIVSFGVTEAIWAFPYALGGLGALIVGAFYVAVPVIVLAGPIGVALYGLTSRRFGFVLGPVVLAASSYFVTSAAIERDLQVANAAAVPYRPPVLDGRAALGIDTDNSCEEKCRRVIALSDHPVVIAYRQSTRWFLYRRGEGEICRSAENARSAFEFLELGYVGKCELRSDIGDFPEGLLFRERHVDDRNEAPSGVPHRFRGQVYEIPERKDGQDRLLGRRLVGGVNTAPPATFTIFARRFGLRLPSIDAGPTIDLDQFLADAIGISRADLTTGREPFPFERVLDQVESYFGRLEVVYQGRTRTVSEFATSTWTRIALREEREHPDELRERIKRLLATGDPVRIEAARRVRLQIPRTIREQIEDGAR
ncbi:MAG TPA: hypothetical protein VLX44_08070 [Xanthobacteraceae bacterium]|nr:hypothetical protein [Xanthobacteraceae bacterium]